MVNLRKATTKDLETLLSIEKSVSNLKTYSALITEDEWKKELSESTVYLIEKDGVVVGDISYELKKDNHAYLSGFAIIPEFQGQGIGREALTKVLKELKDVRRVDLATHPHNIPAIRLYLSFGFIIESWKDNYFGDGEPRIVLAKIK
jgi:ribosomal protein S18 acetylase RimI-like enzyme